MKKNDKCKIVKDILPNYIENLTNETTNEFIEKHIITCEDCQKVLEDMRADIPLQKIENKRKINILKKVKRKNILRIFAIFISLLIIFISILYFITNYSIEKDNNGKYIIVSEKVKFKVPDYTYIILKGYSNEECTSEIIWIATINKKDICINIREISQEYSEEEAQKEYDRIKSLNFKVATNIKLQNARIYQNINLFNGKNKNELVKHFQTNFKNVDIIYI